MATSRVQATRPSSRRSSTSPNPSRGKWATGPSYTLHERRPAINRKREKLQAYFAGLFDGEGSVGVYGFTDSRRPEAAKYYSLKLHITMTEILGPALLWREYPEASLYVKSVNGSHKPQYVFELGGNTAHRFLTEIKPYVILKRDQVVVALSFLSHKRRSAARTGGRDGISKPKAYHTRSASLSQKLKDLKEPANRVNSVNSWRDSSRQYRSKLADVEEDIAVLHRKLEGVETRHRVRQPVEAASALEKEIVQV